MANEDYVDGNRPDKNYRQDRGGVAGLSGPFEAEVMHTVDPTHSGRIEVWIQAFGDENTKDQPSSWTSARYLSPYYGVTEHKKLTGQETDFANNGQAYGMWATAPDIGAKVLVVFSNGQRDKCYYIGFILEPMMNQMIPAIGSKENIDADHDGVVYNPNTPQADHYEHAARLPVGEIDKSTTSMGDPKFGSVSKPVHSVVAAQMWKQGTIADPIRGPISSSAQRESPSYVYGISTPGRPVYTDADETGILCRQGGHTFVMDDGEKDGSNNVVRLRTSMGHQITMTDDGKSIYIQHANGKAWVELGNEGTIDGWAANSINFRTGGEMNFHADKNINFNAGENINMFATQAINIEATTNLGMVGKAGLVAHGGTIGILSDGALATDAASASFKSAGHTEVKGATIGLNDGGAASVTAPEPMVTTSFPDAVQDTAKEGWKEEAGAFDSIVTRAPTHEPWAGHNAGVSNVKQPGGS